MLKFTSTQFSPHLLIIVIFLPRFGLPMSVSWTRTAQTV